MHHPITGCPVPNHTFIRSTLLVWLGHGTTTFGKLVHALLVQRPQLLVDPLDHVQVILSDLVPLDALSVLTAPVLSVLMPTVEPE